MPIHDVPTRNVKTCLSPRFRPNSAINQPVYKMGAGLKIKILFERWITMFLPR